MFVLHNLAGVPYKKVRDACREFLKEPLGGNKTRVF